MIHFDQLLNLSFKYNHIKIYRVSKTLLKCILATCVLDSMFVVIFRQVKKKKELKEKINSKFVIQHSCITGIWKTFFSAKIEYHDLWGMQTGKNTFNKHLWSNWGLLSFGIYTSENCACEIWRQYRSMCILKRFRNRITWLIWRCNCRKESVQ